MKQFSKSEIVFRNRLLELQEEMKDFHDDELEQNFYSGDYIQEQHQIDFNLIRFLWNNLEKFKHLAENISVNFDEKWHHLEFNYENDGLVYSAKFVSDLGINFRVSRSDRAWGSLAMYSFDYEYNKLPTGTMAETFFKFLEDAENHIFKNENHREALKNLPAYAHEFKSANDGDLDEC